MSRIAEGIGAAQRGERAEARAVYAQLWEELGPDGDPLHRCSVAHSMADVQDDPAGELQWDQRALDAARLITDADLRRAGIAGSVRGFFASLHLNLADVHLRLGDLDDAGAHAQAGRDALDALPDDGYRAMIAGALERVEQAVRAETSGCDSTA